MPDPPVLLETELPDLTGVHLAELPSLALLAAHRVVLLQQVERPRFNLGTGPPGRAD